MPLQSVTDFVLSQYIIAHVYSWASSDAIIKHTTKCEGSVLLLDEWLTLNTSLGKYCRKRISENVSYLASINLVRATLIRQVQAKRCVNCTSWQDGRED